MFFVNVVSMKIPITIFICFATSIAQSTGSNSSILESKIQQGLPVYDQFLTPYIGFLVKGDDEERVTSVIFLNGCNCMTTRTWGTSVRKSRKNYKVLAPAFLGGRTYKIKNWFIPDMDDHVAAYFSVIKFDRFVADPRDYMSFVNTRDPSFRMQGAYYVRGWDAQLVTPELRNLEMRLHSSKYCRPKIRTGFKKNAHNLACATAKDGSFDQLDKGTPLFMGNNEMLGVAVAISGSSAIFALVYNDVQSIKRFMYIRSPHPVGAGEGTGGYTGDDTSGASGEPSNAYLDPRCGADTPHLYDTSHMHPGQMGSSHQYDMGYMDPGLMGSSYQYDMGHMDPGQIGSSNQYDMGHMDPGQMSTSHLPDMSHLSLEQTGYPHLLDTSHINLGQMGTSHLPDTSNMNLGDFGSYFSGHTSSEYEPDTDDLMSIVRPPKPIKTRRERSSDAHQLHDGSRSARLSGTMFGNPDVQADIPVPNTSRPTGVNRLRNPRTRGYLQKK